MKKRLIVFLLAFVTAVSAQGIPQGMMGIAAVKAYGAELSKDASSEAGMQDASETDVSEADSSETDCAEKISFSSIKSIMLENSIDMQIAQNTLDNSKQEVTKINDKIKDLGYSPSSISKSIDDLQDEIDEIDKKISDLDKTDEDYVTQKSSYENDKSSKEKTLSQLEQYKTQRTNASRNYKKAQITYDETVSKNVYQCQKDFVSYLSTLSDLEQKKNSIELKEKEAQAAKLKYDNGFLSKKDYDSSNTDVTDMKNQLNELQSKEEIALRNLKLSLGISQGEDIRLSDDLEADFNAVLSINYEDDLSEMLNNNTELKKLNMQIDWDHDDEEDNDDEDHDYENYSLENEELNLEKKSISSEISFKEQYNKLMNDYNSLKSSYDKVQTNQESYALQGKKYSFGFISRSDLDKSKADLDKLAADFNNSRNQFYLDYLSYIQMKEGY